MVDKLYIAGVSDEIYGVLMYRCAAEFDADGYITGIGTDPKGDIVIPAIDMAKVVIGASKLVNGHLVVDQAKANELTKAADTPEPDAQDLINAQMMKMTAQLTLTNADLMKQVATLEAKTNG